MSNTLSSDSIPVQGAQFKIVLVLARQDRHGLKRLQESKDLISALGTTDTTADIHAFYVNTWHMGT